LPEDFNGRFLEFNIKTPLITGFSENKWSAISGNFEWVTYKGFFLDSKSKNHWILKPSLKRNLGKYKNNEK